MSNFAIQFTNYLGMDDKMSFYGIFNDSFPPVMDGVTLTVQNYAHWMQMKGLNPCVVTPWNPTKVEVPYKVLRYFSIPLIGRRPYRYGYPKVDPFIWRNIANTPFKIVHSHCPFSSGRLALYAARKHKVPMIATFHSKYRTDLERSFAGMKWMVKLIMNNILKFYEACDEVWIPQAYVEETVREYGYKGKLTVVENGNDFASIISGDVAVHKTLAREKIGIKDDQLSLLFVGQHIWEKGIGVIFDALEKLNGKVPFVMNFVGNGYALADLQDMVKKSGLGDKVKVNGVIHNREIISNYYAAADLFLFPSFYDNAPLVVREAAAMGTPSILLEGSTAAEVIDNNVNGYLAKRSAESYAELIEKIYADRCKLSNVGINARNTLARSWENVMEEVLDRYRVILKNYGQKR